MPTLTIVTSDSPEPGTFESVSADDVLTCTYLLRDPNEILVLTPRNGGTAYIPVRHITYLHVADEES